MGLRGEVDAVHRQVPVLLSLLLVASIVDILIESPLFYEAYASVAGCGLLLLTLECF